MMLDAREGQGCDHCEVGVPIEYVQMPSGQVVQLCLECVMLWFPGWTVADWEARHAPYRDHLSDRLAAALVYQMGDNKRTYEELLAAVRRKKDHRWREA